MIKLFKGVKIVPSSNIKRVAEKLGRLASVGIVTCGIGGLAIFEGYNNYWNTIIFRVQTVDFNVLSHTLPTKLSYTIIQNQPKELQRTLDSNYSLFGLVVTDPSGQKVIAFSGKKSSHHSWSKALNPKILQTYPYDLLLDPPPLFTQWNYSDPRATERTATNFTSRGRVIGRVYYVRGIKPNFQDDFWKWLRNPISESSRAKTYSVTILACFAGGIAVWSIWEYLLYKKRVQREIAAEREKELSEQNEVLQIRLDDRISELEWLQEEIKQERLNSINQFEDLCRQNQRLQQEILELRSVMQSMPAVTNSPNIQAELESAKKDAESARQKQQEEQNQIQILNQQLQFFQNRLAEARQQGRSYQLLQNQIEEIRKSKLLAELELQNFRNNENKSKKTIANLENQLVSKDRVQERLNRQIQILERTLTESQQREQESHQRAETANRQIADFNEEMERLKEETGRHPLNTFEQTVLGCLQNNLLQKEILTQFDAATGGDKSKFVDFLVIMNNYIITLEVKSYKGIIETAGDPRNKAWINRAGSKRKLINCSWGINPYQQVTTYANAIRSRLSNHHIIQSYGLSKSQINNVRVYGVVVFPSEARIASDIQSNISGYYRVTTLNNLLGIIQSLDTYVQAHNSSHITHEQLAKVVTA